ncbi:hypothetical membrane protein [Cutibacterium acnes JCM 18918]|nr:hypothetical membrane protein [Cutibacterium acnes JCM 18918]
MNPLSTNLTLSAEKVCHNVTVDAVTGKVIGDDSGKGAGRGLPVTGAEGPSSDEIDLGIVGGSPSPPWSRRWSSAVVTLPGSDPFVERVISHADKVPAGWGHSSPSLLHSRKRVSKVENHDPDVPSSCRSRLGSDHVGGRLWSFLLDLPRSCHILHAGTVRRDIVDEGGISHFTGSAGFA